MAQNGMFRNAFRGFNKQEVLQYIDEITAAWDAERKELQATTDAAVADREAMQAQAEEAQAQAAAAAEQLQTAEDLLKELQQKVTDTANDLSVAATTIEEMAVQLEEAQRRTAQLDQELATTAEERDTAIAALADAKAQLEQKEIISRELDESRQQVARQDAQMEAMQQSIDRYEKVLGDAKSANERVDSIVRPYIDRTNRQADDAMASVQDTISALMAQLATMQDDVDRRRQALRQEKVSNDSRLSAAMSEWMGTVQDAAGDDRFFR